MEINPSLGDIERGIKNGTSKKVLYQELSKVADLSRGDSDPVAKVVKEGLKKVAQKIHEGNGSSGNKE
jgi:hypothetical protein